MKLRNPLVGAGVAVLALTLTATSAQATAPARGGGNPGPGTPQVLASGLVTPLKVAVDLDGRTYVSQNFAGLLSEVPRGGGEPTVLTAAEIPGTEVGAVSAFLGAVTYAESWSEEEVEGQEEPPDFTAVLKKRSRSGAVSTIGDIGEAEKRLNPDQVNTYGFTDLDPSCTLPEDIPNGPGTPYSHPYATISALGFTVVADAGANTIWTVDRRGNVRPLAVLPPQPSAVPDELAAALGVPPCAFGHPYSWEPVPTDVELGPDGWLYVTTLPGGPEDPALGARGAIYKINPWTGQTKLVVSGLVTAVDLAVAPNGDVYVAELFADRISLVKRGSTTPQPFATLTGAGAVEWTPGALIVTGDVLAETGGNVQRIPLR